MEEFYEDGYIRVASASIDTLIGNVKHNANEIKKVLKETREKKAQVVVFPELVLSGYTLEDLFLQNRLLNECLVQLEEIMHDTKGHQQIVVIGLPFHYQNNLYNVSAVLYDGSILGIVPKYHIPNYNEYYEGRRFFFYAFVLKIILKLNSLDKSFYLDVKWFLLVKSYQALL